MNLSLDTAYPMDQLHRTITFSPRASSIRSSAMMFGNRTAREYCCAPFLFLQILSHKTQLQKICVSAHLCFCVSAHLSKAFGFVRWLSSKKCARETAHWETCSHLLFATINCALYTVDLTKFIPKISPSNKNART